MQQQDQSEQIDNDEDSAVLSPPEKTELAASDSQASTGTPGSSGNGLNWPALLAALAVAAFFALTARFNSQPSPSYVPAAVFSATGCGLLITAIQKLRRRPGAGLREAALGGFGLAFFQFAMAFTYPGVFTTVTTLPDYSHAFLLTWGLIALFAVVLSMAGATLGHLAFAPPRPLPVRPQKRAATQDEDEDEDENTVEEPDTASSTPPAAHDATLEQDEKTGEAELDAGDSTELDEEEGEDTLPGNLDTEDSAELDEPDEEDEDTSLVAASAARPRRSLLNYAIAVLLLGLLPMMAGYVFAATYDFSMNAINVAQISPALYPTLSLLSGLLPWRLAAPITLNNANGNFIVFTLLWRVPDSVLGNPTLFDVQALETLVFNAAGLAFLLLTMYGNPTGNEQRRSAPWGIFLLLEALFGLILVLPANLWLLRGLEGVLQMQGLLVPLPTIQLLNPTLFVLNLVTGVLFCLIFGMIVRRQYQLWTAPRVQKVLVEEEIE